MDLINLEQQAIHGSGFGLFPDFFLSSVVWTAFFIFCFNYPDLSAYKMKEEVNLDMRNRMVSFVHGVLILLMSAYHSLFTFTECGDATSPIEYFVLVLSGGYFTYDFFAMAWFKLLDKDMAVHHLLCITGMLISLG